MDKMGMVMGMGQSAMQGSMGAMDFVTSNALNLLDFGRKMYAYNAMRTDASRVPRALARTMNAPWLNELAAIPATPDEISAGLLGMMAPPGMGGIMSRLFTGATDVGNRIGAAIPGARKPTDQRPGQSAPGYSKEWERG